MPIAPLTLATATSLAALQNSAVSGEDKISTGCQQGDGSHRGSRNLHGCNCFFGNLWKSEIQIISIDSATWHECTSELMPTQIEVANYCQRVTSKDSNVHFFSQRLYFGTLYA